MKRDNAKNLFPLFMIFFKAGTFTFAGGLAMLPVIERDIVDKYHMMERDEFLEYATLSQTLPGVIALNCATFVGKTVAGVPGMLMAGLGATISAFVLMIAATILMQYIPKEGPAMGAMQCIRAASSALVLSAAFTLGQHNLKSAFSIAIMVITCLCVLLLNASAPLLILLAGIAGYVYHRMPRKGAPSKGDRMP